MGFKDLCGQICHFEAWNLKYTPFQGQIICGKSHLVDTTYYDDHENGQHLNGVNIFIIVY